MNIIINMADDWLRKLSKMCMHVNYTTMFNTFILDYKNNYIILLIYTWLLILFESYTSGYERWPDTVGKRSLGLLTTMLQRQEDGESGKDRKSAACTIIFVPLQRKMQSQLHKHHASTEWQRVLYTESLCNREGAREK